MKPGVRGIYHTEYCLNRDRAQNNLSAQENAERFKPVESLGTGKEWTKREDLRPTLPIVWFLTLRLAGNYPAHDELANSQRPSSA